MKKQQILAIGGGGFLMEEGLSPVDDFILELTDKPMPKICFLPTPAGDRDMFLAKFYGAFGRRSCRPSDLSFFSANKVGAISLDRLEEHLLAQDAIFVSGGNTRAALAIWREWGVDAVLRKAWESGVVLSGMSAGALCWFAQGHSDSSGGGLTALPGLGFLPGACAVHYNGEAARRASLQAAITNGIFDEALAIDDHAAVLFNGTAIEQVVSWRPGANAYRVVRDGQGVRENLIEGNHVILRKPEGIADFTA